MTGRMLREVGAFSLGGMAAMPCAWSSPERCDRLASLIDFSSPMLGLGLSASQRKQMRPCCLMQHRTAVTAVLKQQQKTAQDFNTAF